MPKMYTGGNTPSLTNGAGKLYMQKNELTLLLVIVNKNFQWIKETRNSITARRKHRQNPIRYRGRKGFSEKYSTQAKGHN